MSSLLHALHRRHARPRRLSDPFIDHSAASLAALLATADADLGFAEFKSLLGPYLPAGTYAEVAYFLPLAFDYVRAHCDEALDLCPALAWFCSEHADSLAADGALDAVRSELSRLLRDWTSQFEVRHFDAGMCAANGWKQPHLDHVPKSETVCGLLSSLVEFGRLADVAERCAAELAAFAADAVKAAWLLELLRSRSAVYPAPQLPALEAAASDPGVLRSALEVAQSDPRLRQASPTYWHDLRAALGIVESSA